MYTIRQIVYVLIMKIGKEFRFTLCRRVVRIPKESHFFLLSKWYPFDVYCSRYLCLPFLSDFVNLGMISHPSLIILIHFNEYICF